MAADGFSHPLNALHQLHQQLKRASAVSSLFLATQHQQSCTRHDRPNAGPQRNVDGLFFLRRNFKRANFDHRGVLRIAETTIGQAENAADDQDDGEEFD